MFRNIIYNVSIYLGMVIVAVASVRIYYESQKMWEKVVSKKHVDVKEESGSLGTESVDGKFFPIRNVIIPVYTDTSSFRKIAIDFQIVSSGPQIKEYFWSGHNAHLLYDRLNSRLAPMDLEFPLDEEGKDVIKEKVRRELNQLAKDLGLEGEIKEVYIDQIFAA